MNDIPDDFEFGKGVFDPTPREKLLELHAWLLSALPASDGEIMGELQLLRRACPRAVGNMPVGVIELSGAIRQLERERLVVKRDGLWYWQSEPAKVEPQGVLF